MKSIDEVRKAIFARPHRMVHFVGGDQPKMIGKIDELGRRVDGILLNLEDAVAVTNKRTARYGAVGALNERDFGTAIVWARVNGLETVWYEDDMRALVEASASGTHLDIIMVPKVQSAEGMQRIATHLQRLEEEFGIKKPILLAGILETARGVANIMEIAASTERMHSLHFGPADLAADLGLKTLDVGGAHAECRTMVGGDMNTLTIIDPWNPYIKDLVVASRANDILPFYGPYGRLKDSLASKVQFKAMFVRGCVGAWTLHPAQVEAAEQAFSPSMEEVAQSCETVVLMAKAEEDGSGAVMRPDGVMLDEAVVKQAINYVLLALQIAAKDPAYAKRCGSVGKIYEEATSIVQERFAIAA